jgi:RsmE family RNA methyltransferase
LNLLLLRKSEVSENQVIVSGRRAAHILGVLRTKQGATLRAGIIDEGPCTAVVQKQEGDGVHLRLSVPSLRPRPTTSLVLALPRPKALSRILSAAASFGLDRIVLINAWRVEKSYFQSPRLAPDRIEEDLLLGMEQGRVCHLPRLLVVRSFGRFLEEHLPADPSSCCVLDPGSQHTMTEAISNSVDAPCLIVGPEGGFIERELDALLDRGCGSAHLGTGPLRTETAVSAALGQLALLRVNRGTT